MFATVDRYVPDGSASAMAFLGDAVRLLNLPVDRDPGGQGEEGQAEGVGGAMTLKQASDRVFMYNEEARAVLEELGIDTLEPTHARRVLQNRVENSD